MSFKEEDPNFFEKLDPVSCTWFCEAKGVSGIDYAGALLYLKWIQEEISHLFDQFDLLLTPLIPSKSIDSLLGMWGFTLPFNISGHPALATPDGIQIVGNYDREGMMLSLCSELFFK